MKSILTISKYTFIEVYRSKIMMGLGLMCLSLIILCYVASEFAYGAPGKVALDVGLGLMSLSNVGMAIFIGSSLMTKEIEQKTLYMILSRPISRSAFLIGKLLGLSSILMLNSLALGTISVFLFKLFGGEYNHLFFWTIYFSFFEALTVMLFAVLFSLMTNNTLAVIYSICIFVVGHAINETSKILFTKLSIFFSSILKVAYFIIPNLYRLNLKDFVIYQQNVDSDYLIYTHLYILFYLTSLCLILMLIFKRKNLD